MKAVIDAQLFYLKTVKGQPGEVMTQSTKDEVLGQSYQDKLNALHAQQDILISDWREQGSDSRCRLEGLV